MCEVGERRGQRAFWRGSSRIAREDAVPARGRSALTDPARNLALCGRETLLWAAATIGRQAEM